MTSEATLFPWLLRGWLALAGVVFVALLFVAAPYGRYARRGWGPSVDATLGWVLMELPAVAGMAFFFAVGERTTAPAVVFLALWQLHYLHRTFVFPFRRRGSDRRTPLAIVAMAFVFNVVNSYLNGRQLFTLGSEHPSSWLLSAPFLAGALLFLSGFLINLRSDEILFRLRPAGEGSGHPAGYRIPRGGLFRWVSCPNYLGEILEWTGWAIATGTLAGWSFAAWTAANLVPRALAHHRWYRRRFPDYPEERKALVPWLL